MIAVILLLSAIEQKIMTETNIRAPAPRPGCQPAFDTATASIKETTAIDASQNMDLRKVPGSTVCSDMMITRLNATKYTKYAYITPLSPYEDIRRKNSRKKRAVNTMFIQFNILMQYTNSAV
jgi:hypothetical protein